MLYRCWTVKCKTEACGVCLTLDVIGPAEMYRHALLPPLLSFTITCCECERAHSYTAADVEERSVENSSLPDSSIAFLDALAKAAWPDSDTAGFSDANETLRLNATHKSTLNITHHYLTYFSNTFYAT
jgi:hypothetical protein